MNSSIEILADFLCAFHIDYDVFNEPAVNTSYAIFSRGYPDVMHFLN